MRFRPRWNVKTALIAGVAAAAAAGVMAGAPALASGPAHATRPAHATGTTHAAATTNPAVVTGFRAGPVTSTSTSKLGSLRLGAGNWAIFAKAWLQDGSSADTVQMDCRITAGTSFDQVRPILSIPNPNDTGQAIALNLVHTFKSAGKVTFTCESFGVSIAANGIRITAIKVGKVTTQSLT